MQKKMDVLCVGLLIRDMFFRPVGRDIFDIDALNIEVPSIQFGGDALNQAVILGRLGVGCALAGAVGDDSAGDMVLQFLEKEDVDISHVIKLSESDTTCSYVLCEPSGERHFLCCGNAKHKYLFRDFSALKQFKLLSLGSLVCMEAMDNGGFSELLTEAKRQGLLTAADFSGLFQGSQMELCELLKKIDYVWPSYEEAVSMTGEREPEKIIEALLESGASNVILKLGKDGCLAYDAVLKEMKHILPYQVEAVDTTGAGDNFVAGCIYGIIHGYPLFEAAGFGSAVGAIAVTAVGANKAVKNLQQVQEMIAKK